MTENDYRVPSIEKWIVKDENEPDIIEKIDDMLSFLNCSIYEDDQTLMENKEKTIDDYIEYLKNFYLCDWKIERIFELLYEGEEYSEIDGKIMSYLQKINKMGLSVTSKSGQLILSGIKNIILAGALSDESKQEKIITAGISLKKLLS